MRVRTAALYVAAVLVPVLLLRGLKDLQWHQSASPLTMSFGNPNVRRFSNPHAVLQYSKRWRNSADATTAAATTVNATDGPIRIRSKMKPPSTRSPPAASGKPQTWLLPENTALVFNEAGREVYGQLEPRGTTIHFTFGSAVMMDFVKNWLHFVNRAQLAPLLVGAADTALFKFCTDAHVASVAISPELDVWTYQRKAKLKEAVYEIKSEWKYMRHHDSDFLEMGLVKVAFLWELLSAHFSVLISDLDVVWLNGHWQRWMTWSHAAAQPVQEASLIALADVLVTTDELDPAADAKGRRPGPGQDLNTGVVYFRAGVGSLAMVQQWRKSMLSRKGDKNLNENVNDQSLFNQVVRGTELRGEGLQQWLRAANGSAQAIAVADAQGVRRVYQCDSLLQPCLPGGSCAPTKFTFGTLPIRPFTGGHTWFNQNVQSMAGHEQPQFEPITVHFTFQFGDTGSYPHGKRQRAREAALWAVDPPEYFSEGVFVALDGPAYTAEQQAAVYRRFPEWSPQRHTHMDAPQRQAVRDLLGLATAVGGIMVLPKLWCHCDRYWGFLRKCRFPYVPNMALPFNCPQDALFDPMRWNSKNMNFREHTFLANENVPAALKEGTLTLTVAVAGEAVVPSASPSRLELPHGTPLAAVKALVLRHNPAVRVIKVSNEHLRRLCRWLGSAAQNAAFNKLIKYILTESSRYCPAEDHGNYGGQGNWNWQNPFTAYNCTWGFHHPQLFPADDSGCARASVDGAISSVRASVELVERGNSTTCPRQMLCDWNTREDGSETKPITWCNIEGYK